MVAHHLAHSGISRFVKFRHYHEDLLGLRYDDSIGSALSARFSRMVVDAVVAAPYVVGAREFLDTFHRRLPLFVASGTPDQELQEILLRRSMHHYFLSAHGSPASKGEILQNLVRRHEYAPSRVLMLGDAMADLDGAREADIAFIGRAEPGLSPFPPGVLTIPDLRALAGHL